MNRRERRAKQVEPRVAALTVPVLGMLEGDPEPDRLMLTVEPERVTLVEDPERGRVEMPVIALRICDLEGQEVATFYVSTAFADKAATQIRTLTRTTRRAS